MPAEKRIAEQLFLRSESKLERQSREDDRYIHMALMIYAKHIGIARFNVFKSANTDPHAACPQDHPRPHPRAGMLNPAAGIDD